MSLQIQGLQGGEWMDKKRDRMAGARCPGAGLSRKIYPALVILFLIILCPQVPGASLVSVLPGFFPPDSFQLKTLEDPEGDLFAIDINELGNVVGRYHTEGEPMGVFFWDGISMLKSPGPARPTMIDADGSILGWRGALTAPQPLYLDSLGGEVPSAPAHTRLLRRNRVGQIAAVRVLPGREQVLLLDDRAALPLAVADQCRIAGLNDDGRQAFALKRAGRWTSFYHRPYQADLDLGDLGGGEALAKDLNSSGEVVGVSLLANGERHAFLWAQGAMRDLGTLGGRFSQALAINGRSQVIGWSLDASGRRHSVLWQQDRIYDLEPVLGRDSVVVALNDSGQMVGWRPAGEGRWQALKATPTCSLQGCKD